MKKVSFSIIAILFVLCSSFSPSTNVYANQVVASSSTGFNDVTSSNTFYKEIMYLSSNSFITGFTDGSFKPENNVTRAQAAILIGKALKLSGEQRNTNFSDVASNVTGSGYIASAVEKGIISGYTNGTFRPYEPVTRAQMAIFLNRAFTLTNGQTNYYNDVSSSMVSYQSILNVSATGIAGGYTDGTFRPNQAVTRGQFSAFMARTLDKSFRITPYISYKMDPNKIYIYRNYEPTAESGKFIEGYTFAKFIGRVKNGDLWGYSDSENGTPYRKELWIEDSRGLMVNEAYGNSNDYSERYLIYPVAQGKTWKADGDWYEYSMSIIKEPVTTKAGTFYNCISVDLNYRQVIIAKGVGIIKIFYRGGTGVELVGIKDK